MHDQVEDALILFGRDCQTKITQEIMKDLQVWLTMLLLLLLLQLLLLKPVQNSFLYFFCCPEDETKVPTSKLHTDSAF